jgi:hypothetical protein
MVRDAALIEELAAGVGVEGAREVLDELDALVIGIAKGEGDVAVAAFGGGGWMEAAGFEDAADGFEIGGEEGDVGEADDVVGGECGRDLEVLIVVDFEEGEGDFSGVVVVGEGLLETEVSGVVEACLIEIADTEADVGDAVEGKRLCGGGSGDEEEEESAHMGYVT